MFRGQLESLVRVGWHWTFEGLITLNDDEQLYDDAELSKRRMEEIVRHKILNNVTNTRLKV